MERGLIEESGRSRFGAALYRTTDLFEKLFGLSGVDARFVRGEPVPQSVLLKGLPFGR